MSWLEWVPSNAYEGGVIDSMTPTRATFSKFEFFELSSPFFSTQSLPRADRLLFCERVRPTPRLSPLACRGEVKYNFRVVAWRVALRCQFTRDVTALVRAL